ncbi:DUF4190 domain-containing protein [Bifidobacterium criceti]|uniref:Peptidyl-prolyl cis-trans isomerase n=1 Tax=Bifidobacterium criceti TaxID=1960969 RepID=A0A2A2EHA8_9BIFI|nr:DUF4190 domain-containing protein [Bifidobacterium criceti]PAU68360.1 peptidyl-prolyl cis-trans isomerase [Bifidobacterium criceti]
MNEDNYQHDAPNDGAQQPIDYTQQGQMQYGQGGEQPAPMNPYGDMQSPYAAAPQYEESRQFAQPPSLQPQQPTYGQPAAPAYPTASAPLPQGMPPQTPYGGQYYTDAPNPADRWSALCIIGFIMSFLIAPAGLIISVIALARIRKTDEKSRGMAIAGTIIGAVFTVLWIIGIAFTIWMFSNLDIDDDGAGNVTVCFQDECTTVDDAYDDDTDRPFGDDGADDIAFLDDAAAQLPSEEDARVVYELAM